MTPGRIEDLPSPTGALDAPHHPDPTPPSFSSPRVEEMEVASPSSTLSTREAIKQLRREFLYNDNNNDRQNKRRFAEKKV